MAKHTFTISKKTLGLGIFLALLIEYVLTKIPFLSTFKWVALLLYLSIGIYLLFF